MLHIHTPSYISHAQEYVNGQLKNKYGDAFIRGNNGEFDGAERWWRSTDLLPLLHLDDDFI